LTIFGHFWPFLAILEGFWGFLVVSRVRIHTTCPISDTVPHSLHTTPAMSKVPLFSAFNYTAIAAIFATQIPKPWSTRAQKSPTTMAVRKEIREFLDRVSGGQTPELCASILTPAELVRVDPSPYKALRAMADVYDTLVDKARRPWVAALKLSGWGLPFIQQHLGWGVHSQTLKKATFETPSKGGRPISNQTHKDAVNEHLRTLSKELTGRWVASPDHPGERIAARHMQVSFRVAYMEYAGRDDISYEAFLKMRGPEFKQSARPSDMCDYCERRKTAGRTLAILRADNDLEYDISDIELMEMYEGDKTNPIYTNAAICVEVDRHRMLCDLQREYYLSVTDAPPPGTLSIDMDWKKKVTLPLGPVGTTLDSYHSSQVTVLGIGFYTSSGKYNLDAISSTTTEDSHCSCQALKAALVHLRDHNILDVRSFSEVQVWADVGKHFRSKEMAHFVLKDLQEFWSAGCRVSLNFLVEKHGKGRRDGHFRTLQAYYEQYYTRFVITNAGELAKAMRYGHAQTKEFNSRTGRPTPNLIVYEHTLPVTGTYTQRRYDIQDMESHYCFGVVNNKMYVSPLSSSRLRQSINPTALVEKCSYELVVSEPKPRPPDTQFLVRMGAKRRRRQEQFGEMEDWELPE